VVDGRIRIATSRKERSEVFQVALVRNDRSGLLTLTDQRLRKFVDQRVLGSEVRSLVPRLTSHASPRYFSNDNQYFRYSG
jgi:hypothetical protein